MNPLTKTYVALGLVILAVYEFTTAMYVFGKKQHTPQARKILRLHRIGGYAFLVYYIWISWVCIDLMGRLAEAGKLLDVRGFSHGFLAIVLFVILLLKISFIRFYHNFRNYVPLLGIIISSGILVLWGIAGLMFLIIMK
jgi:hypothetical protein